MYFFPKSRDITWKYEKLYKIKDYKELMLWNAFPYSSKVFDFKEWDDFEDNYFLSTKNISDKEWCKIFFTAIRLFFLFWNLNKDNNLFQKFKKNLINSNEYKEEIERIRKIETFELNETKTQFNEVYVIKTTLEYIANWEKKTLYSKLFHLWSSRKLSAFLLFSDKMGVKSKYHYSYFDECCVEIPWGNFFLDMNNKNSIWLLNIQEPNSWNNYYFHWLNNYTFWTYSHALFFLEEWKEHDKLYILDLKNLKKSKHDFTKEDCLCIDVEKRFNFFEQPLFDEDDSDMEVYKKIKLETFEDTLKNFIWFWNCIWYDRDLIRNLSLFVIPTLNNEQIIINQYNPHLSNVKISDIVNKIKELANLENIEKHNEKLSFQKWLQEKYKDKLKALDKKNPSWITWFKFTSYYTKNSEIHFHIFFNTDIAYKEASEVFPVSYHDYTVFDRYEYSYNLNTWRISLIGKYPEDKEKKWNQSSNKNDNNLQGITSYNYLYEFVSNSDEFKEYISKEETIKISWYIYEISYKEGFLIFQINNHGKLFVVRQYNYPNRFVLIDSIELTDLTINNLYSLFKKPKNEYNNDYHVYEKTYNWKEYEIDLFKLKLDRAKLYLSDEDNINQNCVLIPLKDNRWDFKLLWFKIVGREISYNLLNRKFTKEEEDFILDFYILLWKFKHQRYLTFMKDDIRIYKEWHSSLLSYLKKKYKILFFIFKFDNWWKIIDIYWIDFDWKKVIIDWNMIEEVCKLLNIYLENPEKFCGGFYGFKIQKNTWNIFSYFEFIGWMLADYNYKKLKENNKTNKYYMLYLDKNNEYKVSISEYVPSRYRRVDKGYLKKKSNLDLFYDNLGLNSDIEHNYYNWKKLSSVEIDSNNISTRVWKPQGFLLPNDEIVFRNSKDIEIKQPYKNYFSLNWKKKFLF